MSYLKLCQLEEINWKSKSIEENILKTGKKIMKENYNVFYNDYQLGIISENGAVISSYVEGFDTIIKQAKENNSTEKAKKLLIIPDRKENKRTLKSEVLTLSEFFGFRIVKMTKGLMTEVKELLDKKYPFTKIVKTLEIHPSTITKTIKKLQRAA